MIPVIPLGSKWKGVKDNSRVRILYLSKKRESFNIRKERMKR